MKRTRNVFVLIGKDQDTGLLHQQLQFKGMTYLEEKELTENKISEVFDNNKSVLCTGVIPEKFHEKVVPVPVVNWQIDEDTPCIKLGINVARKDIVEQFQKIANALEIDIGDHKANDSGAKDAPSILDCAYCKYINGERNINQRTVYHGKYFYVVPTYGEFTKGYLLIIPYRHVMSYAELNEEESKEFTQILSDIKAILKLTYNTEKILVWENGTGNGGKGKAKDSVVHAHMHVAPAKFTDANVIEKALGAKLTPIKYEELSNYSNHSYLLVECDNGMWKINNNPDLYIPRQYVRQLLALDYGLTDEYSWNWRLNTFWDKMRETWEDIYKALDNHKNLLPERIVKNTRDFLGK